MLSRLYEYLYSGLSRGKTLLIAVDEAHKFSGQVLEELRMLCNPHPRRPGPGIVQELFAAGPQFEEKLRAEDLMRILQRIEVRCRLEPLSELEIPIRRAPAEEGGERHYKDFHARSRRFDLQV